MLAAPESMPSTKDSSNPMAISKLELLRLEEPTLKSPKEARINSKMIMVFSHCYKE
jgi:hypothetical protein